MWNERFLKVIPAVVFLFCILEIFELVLIINITNESEKLETETKLNIKALEGDMFLLNEYLEGIGLQHFEYKKNRIK
ncbi:hypothetical protein [Helicobacter pylori]|uniref:hypothetical protein n=1 Tax=Helicobacter pylori TaxID=210 RepID=UPI00037F9361|nr:hypothetical protein [Helicobacter pylori]EQL73351.1 hypothetical protein N409_04520 [Helicobacter pylori FD719]